VRRTPFNYPGFVGLVLAGCASLAPIAGRRAHDGQPPFRIYRGPVGIERVAGRVELKIGQAPDARLDLAVRNFGIVRADATIGFRGASEQIRAEMGPGEPRSVNAAFSTRWWGNASGCQGVRLDLATQIDGGLTDQPIDDVALTIVLPSGVPALVRANAELTKGSEAGRTVYYLNRSSAYLTELQLVYTAGPVTLDLEKSMSPTEIASSGPVQITLRVHNLGPADAANVLLSDEFNPRSFAGVGAEFHNYQGRVNDRRLLWRRTIAIIPAGHTITVQYSLTAKHAMADVALGAATASINGELVGVSNKLGSRRR